MKNKLKTCFTAAVLGISVSMMSCSNNLLKPSQEITLAKKPSIDFTKGPSRPNAHMFNKLVYGQEGFLDRTSRSKSLQEVRLMRARIQANLTQNNLTSQIIDNVWELRGPLNVGGRITDIVFASDNFDKFYLGAASGGVWKTTNGGSTFTQIFDGQGSLAIGALAIDPTDSDILYVGTGEANPGGGSIVYGGDGVWKTTDGGNTWQHLGLEDTEIIGRIAVDPQNPSNVFVAATGTLFTRNLDRGVYRSTDGGLNWDLVLFISDVAGAVDIAIDPSNPNRIFTAMWERIRMPNTRQYGGADSGIWRSEDGGINWEELTNGLPSAPSAKGRIGLAIAPSSPNIVYAVYATAEGPFEGFFRSTDSGENWVEQQAAGITNNFYSTFGWWFGRIYVPPNAPNTVWAHGVQMFRTLDGGDSFSQRTNGMHVDQHAQVFNPNNPNITLVGNDGGLYRSTNGGNSWFHFENLPISQFYAVEAHPQEPFKIYGGLQDNGTQRTPNGQLDDWEHILGGDGFTANVDPNNTNVIYAESQNGALSRSTNGGASFSSATNGITGRRNWHTPVVIDPSSTGNGTTTRMYYGSHRLFRSTNSAVSWSAISGDLTNGDQGSNGVTFGTITTISVAPSNPNVIYVGTDDGNVHVTTNFGNTYTQIDGGLPERWVTRVAADPNDDSIVYVTLSGFRQDIPQPHVFRATNHGLSGWTDISNNLPDAPVNDIVIDPTNTSILYIATDVGVFVSLNQGDTWEPLGTGLPEAAIFDLKYLSTPTPTLIAGTFGRSVYAVDVTDLSSDRDVFLDADFDNNDNGFNYGDDLFRNTNEPSYASGIRLPNGGETGGGLQVVLGGLDAATINNMSGGWQIDVPFTQSADDVILSFRYNLTQQPDYEADERSEVLVSVNGDLHGEGNDDFVAEVIGNGNGGPVETTGWQTFSVNLGSITAGNLELIIGGFNNQKTIDNESTEVLIDDVRITGIASGEENNPPLVSAGNNQTITLPTNAFLNGTVSDDGQPDPPGAVTTTWSQVSGPGSVSFGDINDIDTTASFSEIGTYVLRLTADDGALTAQDEVNITVNDGQLDIILQANFDQNTDGFAFEDDTFRNTNQPAYADGQFLPAGGLTGGGLQVTLGGIDAATINNMSGGWTTEFTLTETTNLTISLDYNLTQEPDYEADERSEILVRVNNTLHGTTPNDFVVEVIGNGNGGPVETTGWDSFQVTLTLPPGTHTLAIGGFNNKKTFDNESTEILIDNVLIVRNSVSSALIDADFDQEADGFIYDDDQFRNTNQPLYATGAHLPNGGLSGGGLQVTLGGVDATTINNISGGWEIDFTLDNAENVTLTFDYNLTQEPDYESDERSEILVRVDNALHGEPPNDFVAEIIGNGNGGPVETTGWNTFQVNLNLSAGSHTLVIGGFNNQKTFDNESTEILIDNVHLAIQ